MFLGRSGSDSSDSDREPPPKKIIALPSGPIRSGQRVQVVRPIQSDRHQRTSRQQTGHQIPAPRPIRPQAATFRPMRPQPATPRPIRHPQLGPRDGRPSVRLFSRREPVGQPRGRTQAQPSRPQAQANPSMSLESSLPARPRLLCLVMNGPMSGAMSNQQQSQSHFTSLPSPPTTPTHLLSN